MIRQQLADKIAAQRLEKARVAEILANAHGSGRWAEEYQRDAQAWREASDRAKAGDLSPFKI